MPQPKTLAVKLKPLAEKIVKQGHPWIFAKSITRLNKEGNAGDIAIMFDHHTDKVFAIGLYDPESIVRIKLIHLGGPLKVNSGFFAKKIDVAYQIRKPLLHTQTNAYRLIFGENDGFPGMICDIYNKVGVIKIYSEIWLPYLQMIAQHIAQVSQVDAIVLRMSRNLQKKDLPQKEGQVIYGTLDSPEVIFEEYGVRFKIDVIHGHKTGFFLDHRENRRRIGEMARGKTVLDVFAYAGGFSIHALAGGAKEVTSIDFSKQALELAKNNAELNPHQGTYQTLQGDAFALLEKMKNEKQEFDIVIIDPPSFAKRKEEEEIAKKKYAQLALLGAALTKPKGLLLLASCSSRIYADAFVEVHRNVFREHGIKYKLLDFTEHDIDHPIAFREGAYLKSAYYRIL